MSKIQNVYPAQQVTLAPGMEPAGQSSRSCQETRLHTPSQQNSYQADANKMSSFSQTSRYHGQLVQLAKHQTASAYRHEPESSQEQNKEAAFKLLKQLKNAGEITDAQWRQMAKALVGDDTQDVEGGDTYTGGNTPPQTPEAPGGADNPPASQVQQPAPGNHGTGSLSFRGAANVLLQHFSLVAASDGDRGLINRKDLESILEQPGFSQELKQAAQVFLQNPALFNAVDVAGDLLKRHDGEIHTNDLRAFLADPNASKISGTGEACQDRSAETTPMSLDEAARILADNFAWFASATGDPGLISKDDLKSVLKQPGLSQDMKRAARTLLDNPSFFNSLDNAGDVFQRSDGQIHGNDLAAYYFQRAQGLHRT